jgi:hypothetical protein
MLQRRIFALDTSDAETRRLRLTDIGERTFDFLCALFYPYIDAYWAAALAVLTLGLSTDVDDYLAFVTSLQARPE